MDDALQSNMNQTSDCEALNTSIDVDALAVVANVGFRKRFGGWEFHVVSYFVGSLSHTCRRIVLFGLLPVPRSIVAADIRGTRRLFLHRLLF